MIHGDLKRYWARWPAIIIMFAVGCFGIFILWAAFGNTTFAQRLMSDGDAFTKYFVWFIGVLFVCFGYIGSVWHYFFGNTFYMITKVPLKELDHCYEGKDGSLMIEHKGRTKHITYRPDWIKKRGYIKMETTCNRLKEPQNLRILEP